MLVFQCVRKVQFRIHIYSICFNSLQGTYSNVHGVVVVCDLHIHGEVQTQNSEYVRPRLRDGAGVQRNIALVLQNRLHGRGGVAREEDRLQVEDGPKYVQFAADPVAPLVRHTVVF